MRDRSDQYRDFCQQHPEMPLFLKDWWLDTVCGAGNWNAVTSGSDQHVTGVMPFYLVRKSFLRQIVMPPLTQHMGPWLSYPHDQKYASRLSFEKSTLSELIEQLPSYDRFVQNFSYRITNWLPFYWQGFQQTTYYTYRLPDLSNTDQLWNDLRSSVRSRIRKAEKTLTCRTLDDASAFYRINSLTFERQGKNPPYDQAFIERVYEVCQKHQAGQILAVSDHESRIHAALCLVWDDCTAYYLMGGADPSLRSSGAQSLLFWEAIKFAAQRVPQFDFEGSMHPAIERSFSAFGGVQTPYFNVSKANAKWLKLLLLLR